MILQHFLLEVNEVNLYVIGCEATCEAAIVDAGAFDRRVVDFIRERGLKVIAVILTHNHHDHVDGLQGYLKEFRCDTIAGFPMGKGVPTRHISDGDTIQIGRLSLRALRTTGHTDDSFSFYIEAGRVCFDGDALFAGSIGGTKSDDKKAEEISLIRKNLFTLPEETIVYSGHGPATTIGTEKAFNPFFQ